MRRKGRRVTSQEQQWPHITVDIRKTMMTWEVQTCAEECKKDDKIDGRIAREWKHVDEEAYAAVMLKRENAQWSG